jgi:uncharacterized membrane protein YecN with MAPEG domain
MEHLQADNHPELFPWVLLVMSAISLQCFLIPFVFTVRVRSSVFNKEFMLQFEKEHKEAFPEDDITKSIGFPDMGSGYYSKKLAYKDWFRFNNAQRVHYNFLEALPMILILLFIAGLKQPLAALIIGCVYFVARLLYLISYVKSPNLRVIGVIPMSLSLFALFGLSLYTASEYMKLYNIDLGF